MSDEINPTTSFASTLGENTFVIPTRAGSLVLILYNADHFFTTMPSGGFFGDIQFLVVFDGSAAQGSDLTPITDLSHTTEEDARRVSISVLVTATSATNHTVDVQAKINDGEATVCNQSLIAIELPGWAFPSAFDLRAKRPR